MTGPKFIDHMSRCYFTVLRMLPDLPRVQELSAQALIGVIVGAYQHLYHIRILVHLTEYAFFYKTVAQEVEEMEDILIIGIELRALILL